MGDLCERLLPWYAAAARELPWRAAEATPWGVLVSEIMLQQTPVARVLPAWEAWLARWPTPAALAADAPGEAVRMWGRLGYPRRALRLHETATAIVRDHGGAVPADVDALLALPGLGSYTARAVATFAYGQRHPVVDTNVRRVLARAVGGSFDGGRSTTVADLRLAESVLPPDPPTAARTAVALMELGALVCVARTPACPACPLRDVCAWRAAGCPPYAGPPRRGQTYAGTDRQVRGRLLAVLRDAEGPVDATLLDQVWDEPVQRARALDGLVADGLVDPLPDGRFALPA